MRRARVAVLAALALALAAPAAASPWGVAGKAGKGKKPSAADETATKRALERAELVRRGDEIMVQARYELQAYLQSGGQYTGDAEPLALAALEYYDKALAIAPDADLYYRAFHATSYLIANDPARWRRSLAYFDQFRALAPRDPRETTMLPELCTALSKLGGLGGPDAPAYFERGVAEYDTWRQRIDDTDPRFAQGMAVYSTNAAELLMALGPDRLDDAIEYYETGIQYGSYESLGYYGAAVAYDRDGQWGKAVELMRAALERDDLGRPDYKDRKGVHTMGRLTHRDVYFVPTGDVEYYFALGYHVQGQTQLALEHYKRFLQLLPDSPYAQRAKDHIAELEPGR